MPDLATRPLRIAFVFRAPLGGLFRNVLDLTRGMIARGHVVGIICDDKPGSAFSESMLAEITPSLSLGLARFPIERNPTFGDIAGVRRVRSIIADWKPDVVHGHGSKGGLHARLSSGWSATGPIARAYTPHGGSLNYKPGSLLHRLYMGVEGVLARRTELFLFESDYVRRRFVEFVGEPSGLVKVVHNGIYDREFEPIAHREDARDLVYVGEFRAAKGLDILVAALEMVRAKLGRAPSIVFVGSGPDKEKLQRWVAEKGLVDNVEILTPRPVRDALAMGRAIVVPSLAESLPYVSLEAAGASQPMISTNVGGIPEIFGPHGDELLPPRDPAALADAIARMLTADRSVALAKARTIAGYVRENFRVEDMVDGYVAAYREAIRVKRNKRI